MKKGIALTALLLFVLTGLELEGRLSSFASHGEAGIQLGSSSHSTAAEEDLVELLCEENEEQESRVRILPARLPAVCRSVFSLRSRHFSRRAEDCSPDESCHVFLHLLRAPPAV